MGRLSSIIVAPQSQAFLRQMTPVRIREAYVSEENLRAVHGARSLLCHQSRLTLRATFILHHTDGNQHPGNRFIIDQAHQRL
jgi:hypothetical protein